LLFWKLSVGHLWKDNSIITGVGTGDAQDYIDSIYNLPSYKLYGYIGWDSHNQWIFTLIQIGVAGVLVMALLYAKYLKEAFKKMDLNFMAFLLITFWFSFSESILESNKGIVFFSLFFTILAAPYSKK
jgi:O-antigen ligase